MSAGGTLRAARVAGALLEETLIHLFTPRH